MLCFSVNAACWLESAYGPSRLVMLEDDAYASELDRDLGGLHIDDIG